jgi:hypothetical protein
MADTAAPTLEPTQAFQSMTSSARASSVAGMSRPQQSRMWTPRRGGQHLDLLSHDKRPEL